MSYKKTNITIQGFVNAILGGDINNKKSIFGYISTLGGNAISWMSRLLKCVSLLTIEAKYVAIYEASFEMIWLKIFFKEIGKEQNCNVFLVTVRMLFVL